MESSKIICGRDKVDYPMNSTTNEMYVAYQSLKGRGFDLDYSIDCS